MFKRKQYRSILLSVLIEIRKYNGTEAAANSIVNALIVFEQFISKEQLDENTAQATYHPRSRIDCTLDGLLDYAATNELKDRKIMSAIAGIHPIPGFIVNHIEGVILPPNPEAGNIVPDEGEEKYEEKIFEPRVKELFTLLAREGIFLDDCIVTCGKLRSSQMREQSYLVIEIPRLNRVVIINDQVGEATYIVYGMGDARRFLQLTKQDLLEEINIRAKRVVRYSVSQWHADICLLLFREDVWNEESIAEVINRPSIKLSTAKIQAVRDAIISTPWADPEVWISMKPAEVRKICLAGHKIGSLYTIFNIPGSGRGQIVRRLRLAICLFGELPLLREALRLESLSPDDMRKEILSTDWGDPNKWVTAYPTELLQLQIGRRGITAIARLLGLQSEPHRGKIPMLELGREIFGEDPIIVDALNHELNTKARIRTQILDSSWSDPKSWVSMTGEGARKVIIDGKKLSNIATIFGVKENPLHRKGRLLLAKALFGEIPEIEEALFQMDITPEQVKDRIKKSEWGRLEQWYRMTSEELARVSIIGLKIGRLAQILGLKHNPKKSKLHRLYFAREVFGSCQELDEAILAEEAGPDEWKQYVLSSQWSDPQWWANASRYDAREVNILGKGIAWLCGVFGIEYPHGTSREHVILIAINIFGPLDILVEVQRKASLSEDDYRAAILSSKWGHPQIWVDMTLKEAHRVEILGKKISSLATIFGVHHKKVASHLGRLSIARGIFGDHPLIMNALRIEQGGEDFFRDAILSSEWGDVKKWISMSSTTSHEFTILGKKISAVARIFGFDDTVKSRKLPRLQFAKAIFGESPLLNEEIRKEKLRLQRKKE